MFNRDDSLDEELRAIGIMEDEAEELLDECAEAIAARANFYAVQNLNGKYVNVISGNLKRNQGYVGRRAAAEIAVYAKDKDLDFNPNLGPGQALVFNTAKYAGAINDGVTKPVVITPKNKKALAFIDSKQVNIILTTGKNGRKLKRGKAAYYDEKTGDIQEGGKLIIVKKVTIPPRAPRPFMNDAVAKADKKADEIINKVLDGKLREAGLSE